ncbi:MAG: hydroxyacid dehydrogenase [Planctomycetota bacterium]
MTQKVLVCDSIDPASVEEMRAAGLSVDVRVGLSAKELGEVVGPYHALIVRSATKVSKEVLERAGSLRLVVRGGVGVDNIAVDDARRRGVEVMNTPEANTIAVAEHAIALMFALSRRIAAADVSMRAGRWDKTKLEGTELYRKTLGLVGLGRIATEVARRAVALGMRVIACRRSAKTTEEITALGVEMVAFDDLLARADVVSLHLPFSKESHHLFDAARIARMKKGAALVNCARGGIVDEAALAQALASGHLSGAAIDVFEKEPPDPSNPLLRLANVVLTPHLGASTLEGQNRVGESIARKVIAFFQAPERA